MQQREFIDKEISDHRAALDRLQATLAEQLEAVVELIARVLKDGGKLLIFGNGGSAADAQHMAAEFVVRLSAERERRPLAALALTTDTSTLTAAANDYGLQEVFARQVQALARPGDAAVGISTSGNSANVVLGLQAARRAGAATIALGGPDAGRMAQHADHLILVPCTRTARIQEMHALIGHVLVAAVEHCMGLIEP